MPFTRSTIQEKADQAMNISQHHHHTFESDLEIHVTGGERVEREFLVDMVSTSLRDRGFDKVHAIGPHGFDNGNAQFKPKSVADAIRDIRPDLMKKDIAVSSQQNYGGLANALVDISASSADGNAVFTKTAAKVDDFLSEARDRDVTEKITVSGFDQASVVRAAQQVLAESPTSEVTMKLNVQPWQANAYKPAYIPPYDPSKLPEPVGFYPAQPVKTY